ncbi:hypothetical protein CONCODRAFT_2579 [Conidiobolus coronatus NRRL 28638]|uniref:Uncharacterized protein n=1 Tax=Conidiobolus coronatus (strain ATCC 28846 / CBS 209.66 / NRRL 28638) TaxID=796925 RepID=A0A137PHD2_CONC2|nr:hypothetical protein CONCODRAFT_2579 [Conidiobolus coronatus NRRL 28638]|eukprot:KXN74375.1 hypothetical protein CONCODRAFT_2579 [Conidiobolus coronatus NRRL 28638]
MSELLALIFLILIIIFILGGIALTYSRMGKWMDYNTNDNDAIRGNDNYNDYTVLRLSREFTEPLPRYQRTSSLPPNYTECSQIISFTYWKLDKSIAYYLNTEDDYGYNERILSREFTEPLPRYEPSRYSKFDKWFGGYLDDEDGYGYNERRLSREFIEPLPRYEPPRPSPPNYTECSQIVFR